MMNSPRMELFVEKIDAIEGLYLEELIYDYIQEKYGPFEKTNEVIRLGMHDSNFPFSFFSEEGEPQGVYVEMFKLFSNATGIPFEVYNTSENTDFEQLKKKLLSNELQFILGLSNESNHAGMVRVGGVEVQDNIISIGKFGRDIERRGLFDLTFGVASIDGIAPSILGMSSFETFRDYDEAFLALYQQDVNLVIGRESVLSYYRDVMGLSLLTQTNHINRISSHSILGNTEEERLNEIMSDIQRLYNLIHFGDQNTRWTNKLINYQNRYNELRQQWEMMVYTLIVLAGLGVVVLVLVKETDNRKLKRANERDPLTQLYNKRAYEKKCMELINKHSDKLGIFFFIDLDDFKNINDVYGHQVGDALLINFSNELKAFADRLPNSVCFRIAGDEFGLFSIGYEKREDIERILEQLPKSVKVEVASESKFPLQIGYSAGGSLYNLDTTNFSNLRKFADLAMYKSKRNKENGGRNVELFDMSLLYDYNRETLATQLMDNILEEQDIYAVYQPIYTLNTEGVYGYEGLSRTNNPNISNIMELITLAERANKLQELDLLMMEKVLVGFKGEGKLFINMTAQNTGYIKEYIEQMIKTAEKINFPLERIVVELSERTQWTKKSIECLREYKDLYHFSLAVDDFGVGYSTSSLILEVEPNIVKIDKSLVQKIHKNQHKYNLVKSFIIMLKANNLEIACEGIEEKEELEMLKTLGSDYGQGYYLGKPE